MTERFSDGQATVELVALAPLLVAAALVALAIVVHAAAQEHAGAAAQAGAMALLQDDDARAAARAALPAEARDAATITVERRRVTVKLPPPLGLPRLDATASADAGPEPTP
jgi:hypothetical protein